VLERYRVDSRFLALVRPILGPDVKQITNTIIWKTPGAERGHYAFHQDARFRRPPEAFRELATSFVQTAVAIDPHRPENGCLRVLPGTHLLGRLDLPVDRSVLDLDSDVAPLRRLGFDPSGLVDLTLDPGDVALWGPYLVHGSPPNLSGGDRRSFVNGYVSASRCDLGEWAFRDGQPCPLGEERLARLEDLRHQPGFTYFEGDPNPFQGPSPAGPLTTAGTPTA
jgi:ectoine hydroxylase-related dioxygenase (phytanoyl-CoA dioxygenase family)